MSIQIMMQTLQKLLDLHASLLVISKEKTIIVKSGSIEKLQALLVKERKHVQALEQLEKRRQTDTAKWFETNELPGEDHTITQMLSVVSDTKEAEELTVITAELTKVITQLKQQEQLNQMLIQQSKQFVELSLDMLQPTLSNMNYGTGKEQEQAKRSVFDSKA